MRVASAITSLRLLDAALEDRELIAAQSSKDVAFSQTSSHSSGHVPQQHVAEKVPKRVVDDLEAIKIETKDRELLILAAGARAGSPIAPGRTSGWAGLSVRHAAPYERFFLPPFGAR